MGYKFLIPIVPEMIKRKMSAQDVGVKEQQESDGIGPHIFKMSYNGANATAALTDDGVVLLQGSSINEAMTNTCPETVKKNRELYADKIIDGVLQEDVLFKSPSGAATFVAGAHVNGKTYWQSENGKTIGELI